MNAPINHGLKIADTPPDDETAISPDIDIAIASTAPAATVESNQPSREPSPSSRTAGEKRSQRGKGQVQKLTPDEMELEIERVRRLNGNGGPTLAKDTDPAD